MITESEIMYDALFEVLEDELNQELKDLFKFFITQHDVQPKQLIELLDRWVDKAKFGKISKINKLI